MAPEPRELPGWLQRLPYGRVRLSGGVVGKTSHAIIALIPLWIVVVWKISGDLGQSIALLFAGIVITAVVVWWVRTTQLFAERNPAQAMLEGAQFIDYKKFEAQAKGFGVLVEVQAIEDPDASPALEHAPSDKTDE